MKVPLIRAGAGSLLIALGATMAVTNPGKADYVDYATEELVNYLQDYCREASGPLEFLKPYCQTLVDSNRPQIKQLIAQKTQRQNFLLFSIYQTELAIAAPLPGYHVEVLAIFHTFYIYEVESL
ncbi:MAG: DUF4359 domain-containing protein [Cyanophyceae cyanobacterium]